MKVLNDPVTVTGEQVLNYPIVLMYEKGRRRIDPEVRKPALYGEVKLPSKV